MAFATSLTTVRYYTQADPYYYTVDNRPITDLAERDTQLANELDKRTIIVDITGSASPTVNALPAGWTVAVSSTGVYVITHGLGDTNQAIIGTAVNATGGVVFCSAKTTTTMTINTVNLAGVATHMRFNLLVSRY